MKKYQTSERPNEQNETWKKAPQHKKNEVKRKDTRELFNSDGGSNSVSVTDTAIQLLAVVFRPTNVLIAGVLKWFEAIVFVFAFAVVLMLYAQSLLARVSFAYCI